MVLSFYKYMYIFLFFRKGLNLCRCVRETDGDREANTDCHNFFLTTLYYLRGVTSPLPTRLTQLGAAFEPLTPDRPRYSICRLLDSGNRCILSVSHLGICIYHLTTPSDFCSTTWLHPLVYTGASCAKKFLIDGSVKGQYATVVWNYKHIKS